MIKAWLPVLALSAVLTGCQAGQAAADPAAFDLDRDFVLGGGQEASVDGGGLRVQFTDVLEDSRCPALVACFWTGQARLTVSVHPNGDTPTACEFNTNPAPGQGVSSGRVGEYTVTMRSLEPYPQAPDDATPLEDYRVTLSVAKG